MSKFTTKLRKFSLDSLVSLLNIENHLQILFDLTKDPAHEIDSADECLLLSDL